MEKEKYIIEKTREVIFLLKEDFEEDTKWVIPEYKEKLYKVIKTLMLIYIPEWKYDLILEYICDGKNFDSVNHLIEELFKNK